MNAEIVKRSFLLLAFSAFSVGASHLNQDSMRTKAAHLISAVFGAILVNRK